MFCYTPAVRRVRAPVWNVWQNGGVPRVLLAAAGGLAVIIALTALVLTCMMVRALFLNPAADAAVIVLGCEVKGVDICDGRIEQARAFFAEFGQKGTFECENFIEAEKPQDEAEKFDLVLVHDVIEHIEPPYKETFVGNIRPLLKRNGLVFFGFPAWQMPFGGHQQIGRGFASKTPFIHVLPVPMYRALLKASGEDDRCIEELMSIKRAQMSIEGFERVCKATGFSIVNRKFWFINPHYKQKFNLTPIALNPLLGKIPYFRNYYTTSAFYLLKAEE